jgi:hypothetical protein
MRFLPEHEVREYGLDVRRGGNPAPGRRGRLRCRHPFRVPAGECRLAVRREPNGVNRPSPAFVRVRDMGEAVVAQAGQLVRQSRAVSVVEGGIPPERPVRLFPRDRVGTDCGGEEPGQRPLSRALLALRPTYTGVSGVSIGVGTKRCLLQEARCTERARNLSCLVLPYLLFPKRPSRKPRP